MSQVSQGMEALAARVVLARTAEKSLDVQYYIWHSDESGKLLIKELLDAADRGVRVRMLLDDIGVGAADDKAFLLIDSPALAQQLELNVDKMLGKICYSVVLAPKNPSKPEAGQRLVWIENDQGKEIRNTKEPHTTSWQRFSVGLIGLLPVESQL